MSTTLPPPVQSSFASDVVPPLSDADRLIEQRIDEACEALWWSEMTRAILKLVMLSIVITLVWVVVDQWIYSSSKTLRWAMFLALIGGGLWYLTRFVVPLLGSSIRPEYAARSLERDFPELRQSLTSYVALRAELGGSQLRHRVVRWIGASTAGHLRAHDVLPSEAEGTFRWWIGTAVALALLLAYVVTSPKNALQSAARLVAPFASIDPAMRVSITDVQPGNTESVAGRPVAVSAKIDGLRDDEQAYLIWKRTDANEQVVLEFDAETRRYAGELLLKHSDVGLILYSIQGGDGIAGPFELVVQDVPVVAIASIHYQPPGYTKQSPWNGSGGAIHALDGTEITILATTNRPIVKANIEFNPRPLGDSVQATAGVTAMKIENDGLAVSVSFPLRSARGRSAAVELDGYRISVWDSADQRNPDPIVYPIDVITDLPPEVAIMLPTKSPKDLPIDAQQVIEIHASDPDYGLQQIALEIRSGIDLIDQPVLWGDKHGVMGNHVAEYRLRPLEHGLRIGDTVQVIAVAIDNRLLEHDSSVEPNVSRTDAIEFKIVASVPPPRGDDPQADGVSATDERPANDQTEENSNPGSQDGQPQQGGSGGGEGKGQQQKGGSSGGDGASENEGESGEDQNNPSGSGSNAGQGDGDITQQDSPPGDSPSGDSPSGDSPSGDSPNDDSPGEGEPNEGGDQKGQSPPSGSEPNRGQNDQSAKQDSADGTGDQSDRAGQANEDGPGAENGPGAERGENANDRQSKGNRDESGQGSKSQDERGQQDSDSSGGEAPEHDGQAFERIRDHLEQKRQQQQGKPQPENQNQGQQQPGQEGPEKRQGPEGQASPDQNSPGEESQVQDSQNGNPKGDQAKRQTSEEQAKASQSPNEVDSGNENQNATKGQQPSQQNDSSANESTGEAEAGQEGDSSPDAADTSPDGPSENPSGSENPANPNRDSRSEPGKPSTSESNSQPGTGGEGESQGGDSGLPPEEANAEYAKQATDMVLDYLDQTRDNPDRELLDKLNWSEEDLKRFADRWKKVREVPGNQNDPKTNREITEALKSLGMNPKSEESRNNIRESADSLRSIRDAGNRRQPPAAYRDAFDAFRRAAGRK